MKYEKEFVEFKTRIGIRQDSISDYIKSTNKFIEYIGHEDFELVKRKQVQDWVFEIRDNLMYSSVQKDLAGVKTFFQFLIDGIGLDIENPCSNIQIPKVKSEEQRKKDHLEYRDAEMVIQNTRNIKNKVALALAYYCGLRISEVRNVKFSDIDFDSRVLRVVGKGDKLEHIPLSFEIYALLVKYDRECIHKELSDYLFYVTNTDKPMTEVGLRKIFKKECEKAGLDSTKYVFHDMRKSIGMNLIENNYSMKQIQKFLRHSSMSTTERIYTHASDKNLNDRIKGEEGDF